MNGLDLFSGIGGISLALSEWVRPIAYCENDRYAQGVLLSRMSEGSLPMAPIWDDVRSLRGWDLPPVDIIYGGFPCQDISVAGLGKGLEGERSGLFFEIIRLTKETNPSFVFLENVPAIRTRGLREVIRAFTDLRYDCRWMRLSAANVGANHKRERWFLLAYSNGKGLSESEEYDSSRRITSAQCESEASSDINRSCNSLSNSNSSDLWEQSRGSCGEGGEEETEFECNGIKKYMADSSLSGLERDIWAVQANTESPEYFRKEWWEVEPDVGRVVNGLPQRVDRIKALGNSVVPLQAREAFKRLAGIE